MTKLGLVFSGGGGKGAYEIGAWKALKEFGYDSNVEAVAGTSVGGLNGALFLHGDYELGETLWKNISNDMVLKPNPEKIKDFLFSINLPAATVDRLTGYIQGTGWFSQEGLEYLIRGSNACSSVKDNKLPFYVCALNGKTYQLELPRLNHRSESEIEKWLLASAAIPIVFGSVKINGQHYHDGGVLPFLSNNTPYQPLIENEGCTHIISIFLDNAPLLQESQKYYSATKFWNIVPTKSFGTAASLNFKEEHARELIERGYADAKAILVRFREFQISEEKTLKEAIKIEGDQEEFQGQIDANSRLRDPEQVKSQHPFELLNHLEAEIDRKELDMIDTNIDGFLERYTDNSSQLQEAMFESITTLASTEGRIKHAMNRGTLARLWEGATGKSAKLTAEIQWDLNRSIYCSQTMAMKLAERNQLTLEAVSSLGSRLNYVMSHTNYLTAASEIHRKAINSLAQGMVLLYTDLSRKARETNERLDAVEGRTDMSLWLHGLGKEIENFTPAQIVLHTTKKFYAHTDGQWRPDEFLAFEGRLNECASMEHCSLADIAGLSESASFLNAEIFHPVIEGEATIHPAYSVLHPAETDALAILEERGLSCSANVPVAKMAAELLCSMRLKDSSHMNALDEYLKFVEKLKHICAETGLAEYAAPLSECAKEMQDYKVYAPLIGKFSSGKSTLLNALLENELLHTNVTPETADASELHYAPEESGCAVFTEGKEEKLPDVTSVYSEMATDNLWYYRRYIDNAVLKNLGKLVLVDMPGLESNQCNHEKAISRYIERGDVFLGILSSETAFDDSLLAVLREAYGKGKEIHLIITKSGRRTKDELKSSEESLRSYFAGVDPAPEIMIVESVKGDPGIGAFVSFLYRLSSRFNDFFVAEFEPVKKQFESQIRTKLEKEISLSNCDDAEIKQQMKEEQLIFAKLHETIRKERARFEAWLTGEGVERVAAAVANALSGAESQLLSAAESGTLQQTAAAMVRPVAQAEASRVVQEAQDNFTKSVEKVNIGSSGEPVISIAISSPQLKKSSSGNGAAVAGAAVGGFILGPIGIAVGGLLGKLFGNNKDKIRQENLTLIRSQVIPDICNGIRPQLRITFSEYINKLAENTQQFVDEQRVALEERRSEMLEELKLKREEFEKRRKGLKKALAAVNNLEAAECVAISGDNTKWLN